MLARDISGNSCPSLPLSVSLVFVNLITYFFQVGHVWFHSSTNATKVSSTDEIPAYIRESELCKTYDRVKMFYGHCLSEYEKSRQEWLSGVKQYYWRSESHQSTNVFMGNFLHTFFLRLIRYCVQMCIQNASQWFSKFALFYQNL